MILSKWKPGCESLFHADAQLVANEILEIGDDVTPEQIVERATDENSELHKCFTWQEYPLQSLFVSDRTLYNTKDKKSIKQK